MRHFSCQSFNRTVPLFCVFLLSFHHIVTHRTSHWFQINHTHDLTPWFPAALAFISYSNAKRNIHNNTTFCYFDTMTHIKPRNNPKNVASFCFPDTSSTVSEARSRCKQLPITSCADLLRRITYSPRTKTLHVSVKAKIFKQGQISHSSGICLGPIPCIRVIRRWVHFQISCSIQWVPLIFPRVNRPRPKAKYSFPPSLYVKMTGIKLTLRHITSWHPQSQITFIYYYTVHLSLSHTLFRGLDLLAYSRDS
jgi:hypothetical protein